MFSPLRNISVVAALLVAFTGTIAHPAIPNSLPDNGPVPTASYAETGISFDNQGSRWSKRHGRGSLEKRARLAEEVEEQQKRYWKVSSVWIDDEEAKASAVHRMTTTITVTVDAPTETAVPDIPPVTTTSEAAVPTTTPPVEFTLAPSTTDAVIPRPAIVYTNATVVEPYTTPKESTNGKLVFAHFMVGIVSTYAMTDWVYDMTLASSYGIDGFALNIGKDDYTDAQLSLAYDAAKGLGFKVFISFDFNWFSVSDTQPVTAIINKYVDHPAQFKLPGTNSAYVSTFAGDGFNWDAVRKETGKDIYVVANWQATEDNAANSGVQGLFSWYAWPSENNRPINKMMDTAADVKYLQVVAEEEKTYMAPVSPWFFTHFGKEVPYSKNWLFLSETLWYDRWQQILELQKDLQYLEIVTWNDYGESHHVGPFDTPHTDDGSSKWAKDMPHDAMLEFAKPYIAAFKTGSPTPIIERDMLVYWHRPTLKNVECDATDNCGSRPEGWEMLADEVFVAAFARSPGKVQVTSGTNTVYEQDVPVGVTMMRVPMGPGNQDFHFTTDAGTNAKGTSAQSVRSSCINGIYNYNFISGLLLGA